MNTINPLDNSVITHPSARAYAVGRILETPQYPLVSLKQLIEDPTSEAELLNLQFLVRRWQSRSL